MMRRWGLLLIAGVAVGAIGGERTPELARLDFLAGARTPGAAEAAAAPIQGSVAIRRGPGARALNVSLSGTLPFLGEYAATGGMSYEPLERGPVGSMGPCLPARSGQSAHERLSALKAKIMSADYRADLAVLMKGRDEAAALSGNRDLGYLARYWAGFASWRVALNGASSGLTPDELRFHLLRADSELEAATKLRPDFADAHAALASLNGWLASFDDPAKFSDRITRSRNALARAKELAPDNPRVLWVEGGSYLFSPPQYGGDRTRAIEIYHRAAAIAPPLDPSSPDPDWGRVEALMALAFAHQSATPPDLRLAAIEAADALRLQPDWSYVRDVLMPQIKAAQTLNK